ALIPTLILLGFTGRVMSGEVIRFSSMWMKPLGIKFSLYLDVLSLIFALIVSVIGFLVLLYSRAYFKGKPESGRFLSLIHFFMGAMLGIVLAGDLITLFVFWELTTFCSYLLIGFDREDAEARSAAFQALAISAGTGLAMLAGFVLLRGAMGSFEFPPVGFDVSSEGRLAAMVILIATGALAKSAQFPFHFWLPNAMKAPT